MWCGATVLFGKRPERLPEKRGRRQGQLFDEFEWFAPGRSAFAVPPGRGGVPIPGIAPQPCNPGGVYGAMRQSPSRRSACETVKPREMM